MSVENFLSIPSFREKFEYDKDGNIRQLSRWAAGGVMDSLQYAYYTGNNRLKQVRDAVAANTYTNDIDDEADTLNYKYDKTGNLIEDVSENMQIKWSYYGKVKEIDSVKLTPPHYGQMLAVKLRMKYDAMGNRVVKENPMHNTKEIYVRDAQGNILAVYEVKKNSYIDSLKVKEFYMYGVQRIGYLEDRVYLGRKCQTPLCSAFSLNVGNGSMSNAKTLAGISIPVLLPGTTTVTPLYFGNKRYELNDWLGNVRVVINDRKTPVNTGTTTISYKPQVTSVSDYYSFGSEIRERSYEHSSEYRYGFQKQEKDNEIYGKGNCYYFKFREHDARIGRFWSVDPLAMKYPHNSPYAFAENDIIRSKELEGLEKVVMTNIDIDKRTAEIKIMKDIYIINDVNLPQQYKSMNTDKIKENFSSGNTQFYMDIKDNKPIFISESEFNKGIGLNVSVKYEINVYFVDMEYGNNIDKINDKGLNSIVQVGLKSLFIGKNNTAARGATDKTGYRDVIINLNFDKFNEITAEDVITHEIGYHNMQGLEHTKDKYGNIIYPERGLGSNIKGNIKPTRNDTKEIIKKSYERGNFEIQSNKN